MGVGPKLMALLGVLKGQYRLTYATVPDLKQRKIEVTVARPGTKVRVQTPPDKAKK